jgi:uncharacterized membrane protein YeaQ/YmgE (transglycosylase-associated protein family)
MCGLLAGALTPEKNLSGFIILMIVGLVGGTLGRLIGGTIGLSVEIGPESFVASAIGAMLLLLGYHYVTPHSYPERP